jgi:hypothetical protein
MSGRTKWLWAVLPLLAAVSGCSGPRLVEAKGRVLWKGKPVPSTQVTFQPENGERRSTGVTDDGGNFTLRFSRTEQGVLVGKHKVFLTYPAGNGEHDGKKAPREMKEALAGYDAAKSDLHYEVTRNGQFFEIELKE